jgi:hypothetical protein
LKAGGAAKAASNTPGAGNGGRTEVPREACAARVGQPISSLVEAGRGGLPQDPEATLPALYIAGRDVAPSPPAAAGPSGTLQTNIRLTMRCG